VSIELAMASGLAELYERFCNLGMILNNPLSYNFVNKESFTLKEL